MPGCAAPGCTTNHSRNGFRMFKFPADASRRSVWLQMTKRDNWEPTEYSCLCEIHFEETEYELNRQDGRKLLKWAAIPRFFNVPNKLPQSSRLPQEFLKTNSLDDKPNASCLSLEPIINISDMMEQIKSEPLSPVCSDDEYEAPSSKLQVQLEVKGEEDLEEVEVKQEMYVADDSEAGEEEESNPYECEVCKELYPTKKQINVFCVVHKGTRPYRCDVCSKTFVLRTNLNFHYRTHTTDNLYVCEVCHKSFRHQGKLNDHYDVHAGLQTYECHLCDKRFRKLNQLNYHLRNHSRTYECDVCKKRFFRKSALREHCLQHI